mgnify:CR=1 FL=1
MRLLLDTHSLVWWIRANPLLSVAARDAISAGDADVSVSIATAWEIAIKVGRRGWPEAGELLGSFEAAIADEGFALLPITVRHVRAAGLMVAEHRDPFDRLLAAQATNEGLTLVTADAKLKSLGAPWLW